MVKFDVIKCPSASKCHLKITNDSLQMEIDSGINSDCISAFAKRANLHYVLQVTLQEITKK